MRFLMFSLLVGGSIIYLSATDNPTFDAWVDRSANWLDTVTEDQSSLLAEKDAIITALEEKLHDQQRNNANLNAKLEEVKAWADAQLVQAVTPPEVTDAQEAASSPAIAAEAPEEPVFMSDRERVRELRRLIDNLHMRSAG